MATVIDEFVVTLGLDPKAFTDGQKKALEQLKKTREEQERSDKAARESNKQTAESVRGITREVTGLVAVLIGANSLKDYLGSTVSSISALGRVANLMGQSAPDLQAFRLWVQQTGGNADTAAGSFLKLSQVMQNYRTGIAIPDATFLQGLGFIGATSKDTPLEVFEKFAAWTKGKTGPEALQEGTRLGLDTDTINAAIRAGPNAAADLAAQLKNAPSADDVKRVQDLQIAFHQLRQDILGDANAMLYSASPALSGFLNLVDRAVTTFPGLTKAVLALGVALTALGAINIGKGVLAVLAGRGAGAAAAETAGGGVLLPAAGLIAGGAVLIGNRSTGEKAYGYAAVKDNIKTATEQQLHDALAYIRDAAAYTPHTAQNIPFFNQLAAQAHAIKTELAGRGGASGGLSAPSASSGSGSRAQTVRRILSSAGLSGDDLEAVMRGLYAENPGFDPNAKNPFSTARGIAQWTKSSGRQADFEAWAGHSLAGSSLEEQAAFIVYELMHKQGSALASIRAAKGVGNKTFAFLKNFEAPGPGLAGDLRRAGVAGGGGPTNVQIGSINITTPNGDPKTIAKGITGALSQQLAAQSNSALN